MFLYKKKLCNIFYLKNDTKFLFSLFEKIDIFNKLKQNFECGLREAVCQTPELDHKWVKFVQKVKYPQRHFCTKVTFTQGVTFAQE